MDIVFATDQVVVSNPVDGTAVTVVTGQHWPADDPVVRAYPHFFTDDARYGLATSTGVDEDGHPMKPGRPSGPAETTTAAPGEKRSRTRAPRPRKPKGAPAKGGSKAASK